MTRIIAMWSGPRNISTAMMRSWENRPDTSTWDEPLYACFLDRTGLDHPGRDKILKAHAHEIDYDSVVKRLVRCDDGAIFYQKHMSHHLLPSMDRDWMDDERITHCFLLRDPREMILSLHRRYPEMTLDDTGLQQQLEIFTRRLHADDEVPPVVDARDVLGQPRQMLEALCHRLSLPFDASMLSWPSGPRSSDGAWADYWYDSVRASTGFEPWQPREGDLSPRLMDIHDQCQLIYDQLYAHRIVA